MFRSLIAAIKSLFGFGNSDRTDTAQTVQPQEIGMGPDGVDE